MLTQAEELLRNAKAIAYGLGITVYVRDGGVYQHPPGEEIKPPPNALPEVAGRGPLEGAPPSE